MRKEYRVFILISVSDQGMKYLHRPSGGVLLTLHRVDKEQSFEDKVDAVNKLLSKDDLLEDEPSVTEEHTKKD